MPVEPRWNDRWAETTVETFCEVNRVTDLERELLAEALALDLEERQGALNLPLGLEVARAVAGALDAMKKPMLDR